jgi:hypothetical protein
LYWVGHTANEGALLQQVEAHAKNDNRMPSLLLEMVQKAKAIVRDE